MGKVSGPRPDLAGQERIPVVTGRHRRVLHQVPLERQAHCQHRLVRGACLIGLRPGDVSLKVEFGADDTVGIALETEMYA